MKPTISKLELDALEPTIRFSENGEAGMVIWNRILEALQAHNAIYGGEIVVKKEKKANFIETRFAEINSLTMKDPKNKRKLLIRYEWSAPLEHQLAGFRADQAQFEIPGVSGFRLTIVDRFTAFIDVPKPIMDDKHLMVFY